MIKQIHRIERSRLARNHTNRPKSYKFEWFWIDLFNFLPVGHSLLTPRKAFHPCHPCYPCGLFYFSQISQIPQIFVWPHFLFSVAQRCARHSIRVICAIRVSFLFLTDFTDFTDFCLLPFVIYHLSFSAALLLPPCYPSPPIPSFTALLHPFKI